MKKWIKRIWGSKKSLTWFVNEGMNISWFIRLYLKQEPLGLDELIVFSIINLVSLICLGLIEFSKIKIEYKKGRDV